MPQLQVESVTLQISVYDANTNTPLGSAYIRIGVYIGGVFQTWWTLETNSSGLATRIIIPYLNYYFKINHANYDEQEFGPYDIYPNGPQKLYFYLEPPISPPTGNTLTLTLIKNNATRIGGATVTVLGESYVTTLDGRAIIHNLSSGSYNVTFNGRYYVDLLPVDFNFMLTISMFDQNTEYAVWIEQELARTGPPPPPPPPPAWQQMFEWLTKYWPLAIGAIVTLYALPAITEVLKLIPKPRREEH